MPSARNAATAQSTAFAISGEPDTRPPISSVSRRKFPSSGDGPITWGIIFAAASAHEASVAEHACAEAPPRASGSAWPEANWAGSGDATKQQSSEPKTREARRIRDTSLEEWADRIEGSRRAGEVYRTDEEAKGRLTIIGAARHFCASADSEGLQNVWNDTLLQVRNLKDLQ